MRFVTLEESGSHWFEFRVNASRPLFFPFQYEIRRDPISESVTFEAGPDLQRCGITHLWPVVVASLHESCQIQKDRDVRISATRFVMLSAKSHVEATPADFVTATVHAFFRCAIAEAGLAKPIELFPPEWLTSTVALLAEGIHTESAFDRLPILCDALQDAGCDNQLVIDHLQMCPDHGTSCWVVEMIRQQLALRG